MNPHKLDGGQKHLMRLIDRDIKPDGWTTVSKVVWPLIATLPTELVTSEQLPDGSGRAKLTEQGELVLMYLF